MGAYRPTGAGRAATRLNSPQGSPTARKRNVRLFVGSGAVRSAAGGWMRRPIVPILVACPRPSDAPQCGTLYEVIRDEVIEPDAFLISRARPICDARGAPWNSGGLFRAARRRGGRLAGRGAGAAAGADAAHRGAHERSRRRSTPMKSTTLASQLQFRIPRPPLAPAHSAADRIDH
jgi:hypothetical protein